MYHRMFLENSGKIYTCICITECFWDTLIQYIHVYVSQNVFVKLWYNIYMYMYHRIFLGHSDTIYTCLCITECFGTL